MGETKTHFHGYVLFAVMQEQQRELWDPLINCLGKRISHIASVAALSGCCRSGRAEKPRKTNFHRPIHASIYTKLCYPACRTVYVLFFGIKRAAALIKGILTGLFSQFYR